MSRGDWADRIRGGGLLLLGAAWVAWAFAGIYSIVTGHIDVVHYVDTARAISAATSWPARFEALFEWAPLYPALLFMVLHGFGPTGIYFINPVLVVLLMAALGRWTWRAMNDYAAGVLTVFLAAVLFLTAQGRVSIYLLYPYREPMSFAFIAGGMLLLLRAAGRPGRRAAVWRLGAGCAYVLAAAVREPSILALTGGVAYLLAQPGERWAQRWRNAAVLMAPFFAALALLAAVSLVRGRVGTGQFAGWREMTRGLTPGEWLGMAWEYLHWWRLMFGWPGLALAGLGWAGLVRARNPAGWLLVVPAGATLLFYAGFAVSARYALASAIYLVPLAGAGVRMVTRIPGLLSGRWAPALERGLCAAAVCWLTAVGLGSMTRIDPALRVDGQALAQFKEVLDGLTGGEGAVATEYRARHLIDALHIQLNRTQPDVPSFLGQIARHGEGFFLKPVTAESLSAAKVPFPQIPFEEQVRQRMDMTPVLDEAGRPRRMRLGPGMYEFYRVAPWSARVVEEELRPDDVAGRLFWLNFRDRPADAAGRVTALDAAGRGVQTWTGVAGRGLVPFALEPPAGSDAPVRLRIESDVPLPSELRLSSHCPAGWSCIFFGPGRLLAAMEWVEPPTLRGGIGSRWGALLARQGSLRLPRPAGWQTGSLRLNFELESLRKERGQVVFRYFLGDKLAGSFTNRLQKRVFRHTVALEPEAAADPLGIRIEAEPDGGAAIWFRIRRIGMRLEPAGWSAAP